jgi:hypothetical protein
MLVTQIRQFSSKNKYYVHKTCPKVSMHEAAWVRFALAVGFTGGPVQCTLSLVKHAQYVEPQEDHNFSSHFYRNLSDSAAMSTSVDIGLN